MSMRLLSHKRGGIKIETSIKESSSTYKNLIDISVSTTQGSLSVAGTVFDDDVIRLSRINEFDLLIEPKGRMILFKNTDVPGVIGSVGQILGKHKINIADFRLAHNKKKEALAIVLVDNDVSKEVLEELRNIPACISACLVVA